MDTDARPVLVGFDGSPEAERALAWGSKWATAEQRPLRVVGVIEAFTVNGAPVTLTRRDPLNALREQAEAAVAECAVDTAGVQIDVTTGQPAKVLVEASQEAALVVVGRRGLGPASRMVLGSVSSKVLHHAACTVCVVPADAQPRPEASTT